MPLPRERRAPALIAVLAAAPSFLASAGCATSSLPPPNAPATSDSSSQSPEAANRRSARSARTWGWVSVAIGAEAAVVAVLTSGVILHEKSVRDAGCNAQKVCTPAGLDANISLTQLGGWNAAAWIIAAACLGTGGALLWTF